MLARSYRDIGIADCARFNGRFSLVAAAFRVQLRRATTVVVRVHRLACMEKLSLPQFVSLPFPSSPVSSSFSLFYFLSHVAFLFLVRFIERGRARINKPWHINTRSKARARLARSWKKQEWRKANRRIARNGTEAKTREIYHVRAKAPPSISY